jgi:hypothetical protein
MISWKALLVTAVALLVILSWLYNGGWKYITGSLVIALLVLIGQFQRMVWLLTSLAAMAIVNSYLYRSYKTDNTGVILIFIITLGISLAIIPILNCIDYKGKLSKFFGSLMPEAWKPPRLPDD